MEKKDKNFEKMKPEEIKKEVFVGIHPVKEVKIENGFDYNKVEKDVNKRNNTIKKLQETAKRLEEELEEIEKMKKSDNPRYADLNEAIEKDLKSKKKEIEANKKSQENEKEQMKKEVIEFKERTNKNRIKYLHEHSKKAEVVKESIEKAKKLKLRVNVTLTDKEYKTASEEHKKQMEIVKEAIKSKNEAYENYKKCVEDLTKIDKLAKEYDINIGDKEPKKEEPKKNDEPKGNKEPREDKPREEGTKGDGAKGDELEKDELEEDELEEDELEEDELEEDELEEDELEGDELEGDKPEGDKPTITNIRYNNKTNTYLFTFSNGETQEVEALSSKGRRAEKKIMKEARKEIGINRATIRKTDPNITKFLGDYYQEDFLKYVDSIEDKEKPSKIDLTYDFTEKNSETSLLQRIATRRDARKAEKLGIATIEKRKLFGKKDEPKKLDTATKAQKRPEKLTGDKFKIKEDNSFKEGIKVDVRPLTGEELMLVGQGRGPEFLEDKSKTEEDKEPKSAIDENGILR